MDASLDRRVRIGTSPAFLLLNRRARCKVADLVPTLDALNRMSRVRSLLTLMLGLAGLAVPGLVSTALGQTSITAATTVKRDGRVVLSDEQAAGVGLTTVDRQRLSPEIQDRIKRFEVVREAYLKEQALLRKRLSGAATEEERERVRVLIQTQRAAWLAQARQLREEAQDRLRELQKLMPDRREILQNARDAVKDRRGIDRSP